MLIKYKHYILVFLLLAVTAFNYFYAFDQVLIIAVFISSTYFFRKRRKLDRQFLLFLSIILFLEFIQGIIGHFSLYTIIGTILKITLAYQVICITKHKFYEVYINLMYFFSLVSLVFYIALFVPDVLDYFLNKVVSFFPPLFKSDVEIWDNVIIFTFNPACIGEIKRNSGFAWEPGAFAIFLNIALYFNIVLTKKFLSKKSIIFIIAILTTLSTAGYIALFMFTTGYFLVKSNLRFRYVLFGISAILSFLLYTKLDFLEQKVNQNIEMESTSSRFSSANIDLKNLKTNPLLGYGRRRENLYHTSKKDIILMHRNNGITNLMVSYGIPLTILYFYFYYQSLSSFVLLYGEKKIFSWILLLCILLLGFSQIIFTRPFFYSLLFLKITNNQILLNVRNIAKFFGL